MRVAMIPARGGSKRLPGKNLRLLGERPLIVWSIEAAKKSGLFDIVLVTTDDDAIAEVSEGAAAEVVMRPTELAQDNSPTYDAIFHAWESMGDNRHNVSCIATLQPTNPFRPLSMLREAVNMFETNECDSLLTVSERRLKCGHIDNGFYRPNYDFGQQSRLTYPVTFENGMLYLTSIACLLNGSLSGTKVLPLLTGRPFDDIDIDIPEDFILAESLLAFISDRLGY